MLKGTLTLIGGSHQGKHDHFDYDGIIKEDLTFIIRAETRSEIAEKLRKVLPNVKGVAFGGCPMRTVRLLQNYR